MATKKRSRRILDRLRNKYRLVVLNDDTFEEQISFKLSRMNVYALMSTTLIILIVVIVSIIVLTPAKEYIPGYGDVESRKDYVLLKLKADSLERNVKAQRTYRENLINIISGQVDTGSYEKGNLPKRSLTPDEYEISKEDSLLRVEMERVQRFNLNFSNRSTNTRSIADFSFFTPLKGYITEEFDKDKEHYGVDIVAAENETIQSILDGTVIIASWTLETGYIIGIQHTNDLISFYKHNSVLLNKVGNFVKAGDAIAIIGNSGELTTGPHLHFELWELGKPLDPKDYIVFN